MNHVLIIDDDPVFLQTIKEFLIANQYDVQQASSGQNALDILKINSNFDVILCDIDMPDINGIQLLGILQKRYLHIPIIMLTAKSDSETIVEAMKTGAINYIVKVNMPDKLIATIEESIIQHRDAMHQLLTLRQSLSQVRGLMIDDDSVENDRPTKRDTETKPARLQLSRSTRYIFFNNERLEFTESEFEIMAYLIDARGDVRTYEEIMQHLHGEAVTLEEARRGLAAHIANLRRKLKDANCRDCLMNRRNYGYYIKPIYLPPLDPH